MIVPVSEIVFVTVGSVVLSLIILAAIWTWTRSARRLVLIGTACAFGIIAWNVALDVANVGVLNVDSAFLGLSVQDVGSALLALIAVALALIAFDRGVPRSLSLGAALIVGLATLLVDRFG